jgi:tetratricopeptide (TPR) repeat protein
MRVALVLAASLALNAPPCLARGPQTSRAAVLDRAAAELAAGRRSEAAALYQSAAEQYGSVRALLELARIQSNGGNATSALQTLTKARSLAPNSEDVLYAFAQVSLGSRLVVPAILALQPLARMAPEVADYHYLLGVALMQAGEMILAGESPGGPNSSIPTGRSPRRVRLVLNNRKMFAESKTYLLRALEREPQSVEANAVLAEAEDGLRDHSRRGEGAPRSSGRLPMPRACSSWESRCWSRNIWPTRKRRSKRPPLPTRFHRNRTTS